MSDDAETKLAELESAVALRKKKLSRRKFLIRAGLYGGALLTVGNGFLEPLRCRFKRRRIGDRGKRLVHLTDLHYKGGRSYLEGIVKRINEAEPDAVLCTGDFIEKGHFLGEALSILGNLEAPLFAVPGNHDFWGGADFDALAEACAKTGGRWLEDAEYLHEDWLHLTGVNDAEYRQPSARVSPPPDALKVLLCHYPIIVDSVGDEEKYDLVLAGHSHGGQIRLPFFGALLLPHNVGRYDLGWFATPCGPLHVSAGIGTYFIPIRFACRPDVAIIEI